MNVANFIWAALVAVIVGFVVHLLLPAIGLPAQPWALIVGILVFLGLLYTGVPLRRPPAA